MHARYVHRLYQKAEDIGTAVVALIPTREGLPPIDPVEVARAFHPGARYTIEALAVALVDMYDRPDDVDRLDQIIADLNTARAIYAQED